MLMVSMLKHLVCLRYCPTSCRQHPSLLWSRLSAHTFLSVSPTFPEFQHIPFVYPVRRFNANKSTFPLSIEQVISTKSGQSRNKQGKSHLSTPHPKSKQPRRNSKRSFVSSISNKDDDDNDEDCDHNSEAMPKYKQNRPKVYAVVVGRMPGLYSTWDACEAQVKGYSKAKFKGFATTKDANFFLQQHNVIVTESNNPNIQRHVLIPSNSFSVTSSSDNNKKRKQAEVETIEHIFSSAEAEKDQKKPVYNESHVAGSGAHIVTRMQYRDVEGSSVLHSLRRKTNIRKFLGEGIMTNNQAEYLGAIAGLEHILNTLQLVQSQLSKETTVVDIFVQGDSNLVIQQLLGNWKCKNPNLRALLSQAQQVVNDAKRITSTSGSLFKIRYEHVYRHDNAIADELSNEAMDSRKSWTTTVNEMENSCDDESEERKMGKIVHLS
jgi:ribonuclease HI